MAKKKIPMFIAPTQSCQLEAKKHLSSSIEAIPTLPGRTAWSLLWRFQMPRMRSREQWIEITRLLVGTICGYGSIPIDHWIEFKITPEEVIQSDRWEYLQTTMGVSFRKIAPKLEMSGKKQSKETKVHSDYVWSKPLL